MSTPVAVTNVLDHLDQCQRAFAQIDAILATAEAEGVEHHRIAALVGGARHIAEDLANLTDFWHGEDGKELAAIVTEAKP